MSIFAGLCRHELVATKDGRTPMLSQIISPVDLQFLQLRRSEFGRLDANNHAYLDYTGAALYPASQIELHHARLLTTVFGNPHSENPAALTSTEQMERARARVLEFFHADPAE